jgi:hypothetical protein
MSRELRCGGTLHGILTDDGKHLEVKCKRRSCGAGPGKVVLHTISLTTGLVTSTRKFANPPQPERK